MAGETIEDKVRDIVSKATLKPVSPDALLLDSGLVDSISAVHIALAVEDEFGCVVPATDMMRLFTSVGSLVKFVAGNATRGI